MKEFALFLFLWVKRIFLISFAFLCFDHSAAAAVLLLFPQPHRAERREERAIADEEEKRNEIMKNYDDLI
jgi:predicted membrane protein